MIHFLGLDHPVVPPCWLQRGGAITCRPVPLYIQYGLLFRHRQGAEHAGKELQQRQSIGQGWRERERVTEEKDGSIEAGVKGESKGREKERVKGGRDITQGNRMLSLSTNRVEVSYCISAWQVLKFVFKYFVVTHSN